MTYKNRTKKLLPLSFVIISCIPSFVFAASASGFGSIDDVLKNVEKWLLGIVGGLAVLFIIIGGVRYIISAGNPDQAGAAKKTILYAIIGIIVVVFSYAVVTLIQSLLHQL